MNNRYVIPATEMDPSCLTTEGVELTDRIELLSDAAETANRLAEDLENECPEDSKYLYELTDKLKEKAQSLYNQLQEG